MQERRNNLVLFAFFFILSLLFFVISQITSIGLRITILGNALFPVDKLVFTLTHAITSVDKTKVTQQNKEINASEKIMNQNALQADNTALRDQFNTPQTHSLALLPATIIGMPSFFPGISMPQSIIIDQGKQSGLSLGDAVIYKNNLLGTITQIRPSASLVTLVSSNGTSFTATTSQTQAIGVLKGEGNGLMILDNVILSDQLALGDYVITSLDENMQGKGYPPGLVVGKIISIEKNPSNLFQQARVQSLIDVTTLQIVFVVKGVQ